MDFAKKQKLFDPTLNAQRGYVAKESAKGELYADFKEYLHIGRELALKEHERTGILPNIWSEDMNLQKPMSAVLDTLSEYVSTLNEAFSLCLGAQKNLLEERLADLGVISGAALQHLGSCGVMDRLLDVNRASIEAMKALEQAGYASPRVKETLKSL